MARVKKGQAIEYGQVTHFLTLSLDDNNFQLPTHQWLFQISMKLPLAKIELGPIYDRLVHKFSFSGLKMSLAGL